MTVYGYLSTKLPPLWAGVLTAIWYAVLMTLVAFCALEDQAAFVYGNI